MIGYVTVGTNHFDRALRFYDELFATLGIARLWQHGSMAAWGASKEETAFCLAKPFDGKDATGGNGTMIALRVRKQELVHAMHSKALSLGGSDEGPPGPRGEHGFYGAYFRDLDGNKLNVYVPAPR